MHEETSSFAFKQQSPRYIATYSFASSFYRCLNIYSGTFISLFQCHTVLLLKPFSFRHFSHHDELAEGREKLSMFLPYTLLIGKSPEKMVTSKFNSSGYWQNWGKGYEKLAGRGLLKPRYLIASCCFLLSGNLL